MAQNRGGNQGGRSGGRGGNDERGFAAMSEEERRRIAEKGGEASARVQQRDEQGQFAGTRDRGGSSGGSSGGGSRGGGNEGGGNQGGGGGNR